MALKNGGRKICRVTRIKSWQNCRSDSAYQLKMGSLVEEYEQQYAVLTADITAKISILGSNYNGKYIADFLP